MQIYTDLCLVGASFDEIKQMVQEENRKQLDKWGIQQHTLTTWHTILSEEVGSLAKAVLCHEFGNGEKKDIVKEAIQVATLALKIAETVKNS